MFLTADSALLGAEDTVLCMCVYVCVGTGVYVCVGWCVCVGGYQGGEC